MCGTPIPRRTVCSTFVADVALVNVDYVSPSLWLGVLVCISGLALYTFKLSNARGMKDTETVTASLFVMSGGILTLQGWRLDPVLMLSEFVLAGIGLYYVIQTVELRKQVEVWPWHACIPAMVGVPFATPQLCCMTHAGCVAVSTATPSGEGAVRAAISTAKYVGMQEDFADYEDPRQQQGAPVQQASWPAGSLPDRAQYYSSEQQYWEDARNANSRGQGTTGEPPRVYVCRPNTSVWPPDFRSRRGCAALDTPALFRGELQERPPLPRCPSVC